MADKNDDFDTIQILNWKIFAAQRDQFQNQKKKTGVHLLILVFYPYTDVC